MQTYVNVQTNRYFERAGTLIKDCPIMHLLESGNAAGKSRRPSRLQTKKGRKKKSGATRPHGSSMM